MLSPLFNTVRMLKQVNHYTLPPRRAKTRPFPGKAAAEVKAAGVAIPPAHPKRAKTRSFPWGYVEDFEEARTNEW